MSHEPLLRRAANPAQFRVLGLPLRPFSIGHALLLSADEGEAMAELVALSAAVWICSNTWRENCQMQRSLLDPFKVALWRWRQRHCDIAAEVAKFRKYVKDGSADFPRSEIQRPERSEGGRQPGAPFLLQLQQFLMVHFELLEEAAWDYPLGLAKMRWANHYEQGGCLEIMSEGEAAFDRAVMAAEKKGAQQLCRH